MIVDQWTGARAHVLRSALRLTGEAFAHDLGIAVRTVAKWDAEPGIIPQPSMQQILDTMLERAPDTAQARFALLLGGVALQPSTNGCEPREVMMAAAHESAEDAALLAARCEGECTEDLHDQVIGLARGYSVRPPMVVFGDARATRDLTKGLAERTHRPADLIDLYAVLGQTNALMGSIAFDLGNWEAAASLARTSTVYADMAGHNSLQAWTLGLQATLAFWRGEPERSLRFISRGLAVAPEGAPSHRLRYIASRAYAVQGNADAAASMLEMAARDREAAENLHDELHHEVRGEFAFDDARAAACGAAAWLQLKNGKQAVQYSEQALDAYSVIPENRRPFSPINGVKIDLASAHLLLGDRDQAETTLSAAFALPVELRNASLAGRLVRARTILASGSWRGKTGAEDLRDRIEDWLQETAIDPRSVDEVT